MYFFWEVTAIDALAFGIMGGDLRYKFLLESLVKEGYPTFVYQNEFIEGEQDLVSFLSKINVLIAPIPCSKNDSTVFLSGNDSFTYQHLFKMMNQYHIDLMFGGVITKHIKNAANIQNICAIDFFDQEDVAIKNAIPTAEGAILTAIQESKRTIFGSDVIVLGYGRCGKILSHMLKGIGANVSVTYRNDKDAAYIKAYGLHGVPLSTLAQNVSDKDFIFNTIPAKIVTSEIIEQLKKSAIIIDLAQAPGGVDFNFARSLDINAIYCPGLPGRIAPISAAEILKEAILRITKSHMSLD